MESYRVTITYLTHIEANNKEEAEQKAIEEVEKGYWAYTDIETESVAEILQEIFKKGKII